MKITVGHVDCLPQGIVGRHYLLSFGKGRTGVPYAKGDKKGSIEAPFLSAERIDYSPPQGGHSDTSGSFRSVRNLPDRDCLDLGLNENTTLVAPQSAQLRPIYLTRHRPPFTGRSRIRIIACVLGRDTGVNSSTPEDRGKSSA